MLQGGRAKAYRPMAAPARRRALDAGLAAYDRGDFFLAHELLEPAWMGTSNVEERELLQGLIKLAAAYVHAVRGNPAGVAKNLRGASLRLEAGAGAGTRLDIDVPTLIDCVRRARAALDGASAAVGTPGAPQVHRSAGTRPAPKGRPAPADRLAGPAVGGENGVAPGGQNSRE